MMHVYHDNTCIESTSGGINLEVKFAHHRQVKGGNYFGVPGRMSLPDLSYEKRQFASCDTNKDHRAGI